MRQLANWSSQHEKCGGPKQYEEEFLLTCIQYVLANLELRRPSAGSQVRENSFAGHKYELNAGRIHSIDLLLSTYETAVQKNLELINAKNKLEQQACQLPKRTPRGKQFWRRRARSSRLSCHSISRTKCHSVLPSPRHHHRTRRGLL
ncbi:hypothetical protein [Verrucomicrobium spinosum]|uniref:hypothetical protein n=1 Tax=Verrucomicrobium spinosum TaxID=2736 RepID=UPI001E2F50F2|nr:hypothetical protein [Verrucomicrobium spinosum]